MYRQHTDVVEIPEELVAEHKKVALCINTLTVNGIKFLFTISKRIKYHTAEQIPDQTAETFFSKINNVLRIYNKAGFTINSIHCNGEYQTLMSRVQDDTNTMVVPVPPTVHQPDIKRSNRVIQERV